MSPETEVVAPEMDGEELPPVQHRKFAALNNRQFLHFWIAITLALAGLWIRITVQGFLVYDMTSDKFLLGLVGFLSAMPVLLLSPIVGVVVDRFERRKVLFATQAFMATNLLVLATLDAFGALRVSHILIIATLTGAASAFDWPARLSLVPNLVKPHELQSAVALNSAAFNGARIVGPVVGGMLIAVIGTAACFYLSAFAFLPSMLVLLTLTVDRALPAQKRDSAIRTLVDGYQYIWKFPTLRSLLSVDLVPVIFGMSFFTLLPALTRDVYDRGAEGLGFLYAADGAGAFIGVMIIAAMTSLRRRGFWVIVFVFLFAVIQILFSFAPTLYIGMVFIFGLGLVSAIYGTLADTLIQTIVHDEFRGRVMAVYSTFWGLTPIGYLQIGIIAQHWGTQRAILVNACVVLLYVLALIKWNPEVRRLN
ncbi:MAG TPA: MFS transporter [Thermomicrobiales bacterium]|nr:MFS transporter [Thermomicrobiales bacterium]HQZ88455.1 MFS transporter [Thermomicrobiales bacterium]HRA30415.1 MFS transporter [Thermomicrobiales bacterium]